MVLRLSKIGEEQKGTFCLKWKVQPNWMWNYIEIGAVKSLTSRLLSVEGEYNVKFFNSTQD